MTQIDEESKTSASEKLPWMISYSSIFSPVTFLYLNPGSNNDDMRSYGSEGDPRGKKVFVSYYQWVPMVIAIQAVLFHMPYIVWWTFAKRGGLHLPHLMYGKEMYGISIAVTSRFTIAFITFFRNDRRVLILWSF